LRQLRQDDFCHASVCARFVVKFCDDKSSNFPCL